MILDFSKPFDRFNLKSQHFSKKHLFFNKSLWFASSLKHLRLQKKFWRLYLSRSIYFWKPLYVEDKCIFPHLGHTALVIITIVIAIHQLYYYSKLQNWILDITAIKKRSYRSFKNGDAQKHKCFIATKIHKIANFPFFPSWVAI